MNNQGLVLKKRENDLNKEEKLKNTKFIILLASVISSMNVLFPTNYIVSMIVIILELFVLTYFFLKRDITNYLGCYLIFLCLSFEFDVLVGAEHFYGFKNFRLFGINLGIVSLIPILALAFIKGIKVKKIKQEFGNVYKFAGFILLMNITGIIFGLFHIMSNDNNVQNIEGFLSKFVGESYNMVAIPLLIIISIMYILSWEKGKITQLEKYMIAILIGVVISMVVSLATGNFGSYGGVNTLLVSYIIQFIPFMLFFPLYKGYKWRKEILIFGLLGAILTLIYNSTGKLIFLYLLSPITIMWILWKKGRFLPLILTILIFPLFILVSTEVIDVLVSNSILFNSKLDQAISMLRFWDPNWLNNMHLSPRTRIVEFISILQEYHTKPWLLLFGKGYMGTITDHTGLLASAYVPGSFSEGEWMNGSFYALHGTLSMLLLNNGILGLFFYIYIGVKTYINITKSPWVLIGGYWFLLFYGFSITISAFGITALLLGFIMTSQENNLYLKEN